MPSSQEETPSFKILTLTEMLLWVLALYTARHLLGGTHCLLASEIPVFFFFKLTFKTDLFPLTFN